MVSNISDNINAKRGLKLHNNPKHPICQMKHLIQSYFVGFHCFDNLSEVVSIRDNFDDLLIPKTHPARAFTDTYYVDEYHVLRTHTSAHQNELMRIGETKFLIGGDVYRKDTIDKSHYPVFHQIEGVKIVDDGVDPLEDLKATLSGLIEFLYPGKVYRFLDDYFPFTNPSLQIEVEVTEGEWMEILGGGVIEPQILQNCNIEGRGWAFGLGLDRLLMHKCTIPDIRYLWTNDERFLKQFENGLTNFIEYSKYPSITRDISFWVSNQNEAEEGLWSNHNDFCEQCRDLGHDLIESISLIDRYTKDGKVSFAYRIVYRSNDRTLLNEEINEIQSVVRNMAESKFMVTLR